MNRHKVIKRRQFVKAVPGAVLGVFTCPYLASRLLVQEAMERPGKSQENSVTRLSLRKENIMEKPIKYIEVKVLSVKGTCGMGHKPGDVVKITEAGVEGKICIHALYSMLPAVFAMLYEARFPWLKENPDKKTHACPDAANPVVFEITRVRE